MFRKPKIGPTNLVELLEWRAHKTPHAEAYKFPIAHGWGAMTWQQVYDRSRDLAAGLVARGINPGDRVAIMSASRIDWFLSAFAILQAGATVVAIYPETGVEGVRHVLQNSGSRLVFAENYERASVISRADERMPVVCFDGTVETLDDLAVADVTVLESLAERKVLIKPRTLATLIYTSGSTGAAKGVMLTHDNWLAEAQAIAVLDIVNETDVEYFWLPLAHSFGMALMFGHLAIGFLKFVDGDPKRIVANLQDVKPTFMAGPPRTFEKIAAGVNAKINGSGRMTQSLYKAALAEGRMRLGMRRALHLPYKPPVAGLESLVFTKLTASFGGRLRLLISGGAALSPEIGELFDLWGIPVLVGYGLSETCGASTVMRPDRHVIGSVGSPLPGTDMKIAAPIDGQTDGEILLKGRHVMVGYYGDELASRAAFDAASWFRTGDLGRIVDGSLFVTGRLKFSGKLSSGKYVAPEQVETLLTATGYIAHAIVVADGRKFVTAVVSLDPDNIRAWADKNGVEGEYRDIVGDARTRAMLDQLVASEVNAKLERWERVVKFAVAEEEFTVTNGFLTPSNKVVRHTVLNTYGQQIDALYEER